MAFSKNLRYLRKKNKLSQEYIAEKLGYKNYTTVQKWETGKSEPNMSVLKNIADMFDVEMNDLINEDLTSPTNLIKKSKGIKRPILGICPCGTPIEAIEDVIGYFEISEQLDKTGEFYGLVAKGDSMLPRIENKDLLVVKQVCMVESGEIAIVKVNGDECTCKKVIINDYGITLMPLNPQFEPQVFTKAEVIKLPISICGKVMESRRSY